MRYVKFYRMDLISHLSNQFQKGFALMMNPQGDQNENPASDAFNFFGRREPLPDAPQMSSNLGQVLAGVYQGAVKPGLDFMASPAGLATAPLAGGKAIQAVGKLASPYFVYQGGKDILSIDPSTQSTQEMATKASSGLANLSGALGAAYAGRTKYLPGRGQEAMIAWHGSPFDFDQFSMENIGSGEGAQAYGHGLYFAESPEVAKSYRDLVKPTENPLYSKIKNLAGSNISPESLNEINGFDTVDEAIDQLRGWKNSLTDPVAKKSWSGREEELKDLVQKHSDAADWLDKNKGAVNSNKSTLYKVDLSPEHEDFLHWDKTLGEQSPKVKKAIENYGMYDPDITGEEFHRNLVSISGGESDIVSNELMRDGIPGIAYLDAGSRGTGKGTHNYVMFVDQGIKILEKNPKTE